ncbi:Aminoglycoside phosphotransferase [Ophiocordyceps sinensis CO18]|uniref:Aminoglycoside phosphotransferase n=1 Tax=Ophiocordyceps sinensis (strain Co18 / CGMCC 3.14243) TaxID=911162 RepID=T5AJG9_OPHSC|nr:Aminoglycoside phosphotransferase [Ophiocordyceps sinensis CO18]
MTTTLNLANRHPIAYSSAKRKEFDVITRIAHAAETENFRNVLQQHDKDIIAVTKHHLRLGPSDTCRLQPQWITGGFNVCIPIQVTGSFNKRLLLRCPLPHMHAEPHYPGTVDENMRGEVGAYAWMQESCPDIRIPRLYGFGFSNNTDVCTRPSFVSIALTVNDQFTHESRLGIHVRLWRRVRRALYRILRYPALARFAPNPLRHDLPTAYMVMEYVGSEVGQTLSDTWDQQREDPAHLETLCRSMARIMLAVSRVPQPRIGSFRFNDDGTITLANRPLVCSTMILESEGTPRTMRTDETYGCTEPFVADMIRLHDNRLLSNPSATDDEEDCRSQMAIRALLRTMSHHFVQRERRNGPFGVQLTDIHPGNILVDKDWNITCIFDLGEMCALPLEMVSVPYWLTGRAISQLQGEHLEEFDRVRRRFMQILEKEESSVGGSLSKMMHETWESQGVWFWHSLTSVDAAFWLVADHLCPKFQARLSLQVEQAFSQFWCENTDQVVRAKMEDYKRYDNNLRQLFNS